jgi:hypothetical protein
MTQDKRHHFAIVILPIVERYARMVFSWCSPDEREERTAEAVAAAFVGYVSLVNRGRDREVTAWSLAFIAARRARSGRHVGGSQDKATDVMTKGNGFTVLRFGTMRDLPSELHEALIENTRSPVPEQAAFRIDFPEFLASQSGKKRRVAKLLAVGNRATDVAHTVGVSPSRVTQIRRQLCQDWQSFTE